MKPLGIRVRLTALYSLILALSLCLFGGIAYFAMSHSIRTTVDAGLLREIDRVRAIILEVGSSGRTELQDELREFADGLGPGGRLCVADATGSVVFASPGLESLSPRANQRNAHHSFKENIRGQRFRAMREQMDAGGVRYDVELAVSTEDFEHSLARFRLILFSAVPAFLVLAGFGGYWMSRRALGPVDEITRAAQTISAQDLGRRLVVPRTGDELERLANTLNEMLARLEAAFRWITQFTADASHELRTPVSVMRTSAEIALRKPRTDAEYRETLSQILRETEKVSQLIEQLLALARADAGSSALPMIRTDLTAILKHACQRAKVLSNEKQLTFSQELSGGECWTQGDASSLERLFTILLDNAVKYTPAGGHVAVHFYSADGFANVEVRDSGIGISAGDLPHVFDRFFRADRARSPESGGTGLGLAIARWIVDAHRGEIHVQSEPSKGSSFQVKVPLSTE
jgi:heavy metal sensor kinase